MLCSTGDSHKKTILFLNEKVSWVCCWLLLKDCWIKVHQEHASLSVHLEVIHSLSNIAMWTGCSYVRVYLCSNRFIAGYILSVQYASGKCYLHLQDKMSARVEKWLKEHCFFYQHCLQDRVAWLECAFALSGLFCVF